jgi:hypothetical protein
MSNPGTPPPMLNMINSGALGAMPNASSRKVVPAVGSTGAPRTE